MCALGDSVVFGLEPCFENFVVKKKVGPVPEKSILNL